MEETLESCNDKIQKDFNLRKEGDSSKTLGREVMKILMENN